MAKYFATSLAIEKVVSAPRVISSCLPMADDLDELGRVAVEIDHVAGLARGLRAGLHGDADIGLGERRRVVGAVAAHGDQLALGLLLADQAQLVLGRRLRRGSRRRRLRRRWRPRSCGLSPVIITVRMPMRRSSAKRSRMPPLTMSFRWMTPSTRPSRDTPSGVPPALAMRRGDAVHLAAPAARCRSERGMLDHRIDGALADRPRRRCRRRSCASAP